MTPKFKFGDRVRLRGGAFVFIFIAQQGSNDAAVICEGEAKAFSLPMQHLELIPHPDTVRLDWIEEVGIKITPFSIPSYAGDYYGGWELSSEHTNGTFIYDMPYAGEELRECIDVAMEQEEKK